MSAGGSPRIAGAPISWGVCEAPGWGAQLDADVVLDELVKAGFSATEAGPDGFLPDDAEVLRRLLDLHGLALAGAFLPLALHDAAARARAGELLAPVLHRLRSFPGAVLNIAVMGERGDFASRELLDAAQWRSTLAGLDALRERSAAIGVPCCVHPHAGTAVERSDDVARVLEGSSIGLCIDTGHLALGDVDVVRLVREAGDRVVHVHLKDVRAPVAARWRAGDHPSYDAAVAEGLYPPLGEGDAQVEDVLAQLVRGGYDGWYVLERDAMAEERMRAAPQERVTQAASMRAWVEAQLEALSASTGAGATA